jgi:hypothetical protein
VADWEHIVAVFLIGSKRQVRNYQPQDPFALLGKVLGIYVGWADEPLPPDISRWKLKEFHINKSSRHGDSMVVCSIWQVIEDATAALKKKH